MSVICSDSDNDVDSFQIDYYSKAYKKGRSGPTTCFSPKSHSVPAFRSRMRPLSLSRSNRKQQCSTKPSYSDDRRKKSVTSSSGDNLTEYQSHILSSTVENSTEQHFISELSVGRKPDHHYPITNTEDELKVADVRLLSPHDNSKQVLAQDDTKDMGYTSMKSSVGSNAAILYTTKSTDPLVQVNQARTPSLGNRRSSGRKLSSRTPGKGTPRRRRKKPSPPLPPYRYLMTDDIPEDDISSYSSDDTQAIRTKGSLMLESFRLAGLENRTDKILEIEKWRLESNSEWPPCT